HAATAKLVEARDIGQVIFYAGCEQQGARFQDALGAGQCHAKSAAGTVGMSDFRGAVFHAVLFELLAAQPPQFGGGASIAREKAVAGGRGVSPVLATPAYRDPGPPAAEYESGPQSRRSGTNDDDVVHKASVAVS